MKTAPCFDGLHREPVDQTAGIVFSAGVKYHNPVAVKNPHWETCPPIKKSLPGALHLGGVKFGRFTVIGLLARKNNSAPAKWVVRCSCGDYETRSARAIRNPENFGDRCCKCRRLAFEKKRFEFLKSGIQLDQRKL